MATICFQFNYWSFSLSLSLWIHFLALNLEPFFRQTTEFNLKTVLTLYASFHIIVIYQIFNFFFMTLEWPLFIFIWYTFFLCTYLFLFSMIIYFVNFWQNLRRRKEIITQLDCRHSSNIIWSIIEDCIDLFLHLIVN